MDKVKDEPWPTDPQILPPWTEAPCESCGIEFQATRTESREGPFICEGCEMYDRGYKDGFKRGYALGLQGEER